MKYKIISSDGSHGVFTAQIELKDRVQESIDSGYEPIGGVSIVVVRDKVYAV